ALTSFPYAILPNKLLQELRALATGADLAIPLVDEVAADIFMGEFSPKFLEAARWAAELLQGSLYAAYYGIDYATIRLLTERRGTKRGPRGDPIGAARGVFVRLWGARGGVPRGTGDPATNGMIIEQQQILTTHNLAALFVALKLSDAL